MEDFEILDMDQEGEAVTPRDVDDGNGTPAEEADGVKSSDSAEQSGKNAQSHEDNRRYQAARRSGEKAGYDKAMREINERIARSGMRDPGSGETIRSIEALESYGESYRKAQIKQRAQKEGRSEAEVEEEEANRAFVSESRRKAEEDRKQKDEEKKRLDWARQDAAAFGEEYPDVDLGALTENKAFIRFCGSRFGREPLAGLYADFLEVAGEAGKAAAAKAESKDRRSTGTGAGSGAEALTAAQQKELDEWNRSYPQMKMTAKEYLAR